MRIKLALVALILSVSPAFSQGTLKPKSTLSSEVSQQFPDNISGLIAPSNVRTVTNDIVASYQQAPQVNAQVGTSYAVLISDYGSLITLNNAAPITVTLPQPTGAFISFNTYVNDIGAGTATISATGATINGGSSVTLTSGNMMWFVSDGTGTNYRTVQTLTAPVIGANIANATITGANIAGATITGANLAIPTSPPQGRCTLSTGVPVLSSTVSAASTVFYTPYNGTIVPLWNGSAYVPTDTGGELSQATTDATKSPAAVVNNSNYDVFVWSDGGTIRATRGPPWTSDTARGTGAGTTQLSYQNGLLLNTNAITNGPGALRGTYVCTVRSNGTATIDMNFGGSASGGTAGILGVWNNYNRVNTTAAVTDSGTSYTYTTATVRQARASAGNQVTVVVGLAEDSTAVNYMAGVTTAAAAGANTFWGIGVDTTSAFSFLAASGRAASAAVQTFSFPAVANVQAGNLGIGKHVISANEQGDGTNANTFDNSSANVLFVQMRM